MIVLLSSSSGSAVITTLGFVGCEEWSPAQADIDKIPVSAREERQTFFQHTFRIFGYMQCPFISFVFIARMQRFGPRVSVAPGSSAEKLRGQIYQASSPKAPDVCITRYFLMNKMDLVPRQP